MTSEATTGSPSVPTAGNPSRRARPLQLGWEALGPLPDLLADRHPAPVTAVRSPTGDALWLVTNYDLARQVLADPRLSRAAAAVPGAPALNSVAPSPTSIMSLDGADHARLRRMTMAPFSPRRIGGLRPFIERTADELLDALVSRDGPGKPGEDRIDLVRTYASPLPLIVLCAQLGVPATDLPLFESAVEVLFDLTVSSDVEKLAHQVRLVDYMSELIRRRRASPAEDLLDDLARANDGGQLSDAELIHLALAILMAGYETTAGQIAMSALALLDSDPAGSEARGRPAGTDPTTTANLVDELLRLSPATPLTFPRVAVADVELGDVTVRAGEAVLVSILHANRDEQAFDDATRAADERRTTRHLAYGHGPHRCLGAALASLQVEVALERLFARFPQLSLAPGAVRWKHGLATRGLAGLDVRLG